MSRIEEAFRVLRSIERGEPQPAASLLPTVIVYGDDGIHDDTDAIEAHYKGKARAVHPDGTPFPKSGVCYTTSRPIIVGCAFTDSDESKIGVCIRGDNRFTFKA